MLAASQKVTLYSLIAPTNTLIANKILPRTAILTELLKALPKWSSLTLNIQIPSPAERARELGGREPDLGDRGGG
jgi:hypothetical protein